MKSALVSGKRLGVECAALKPLNKESPMQRRSLLFALAFALSLPATARELCLSPAPVPWSQDTETVTNAAISVASSKLRIFKGHIALTASPSNNVEMAFGHGTDGTLDFGTESFLLGWDRGAWFLASQTNRIESATSDETSVRSLSFEIRTAEDGVPLSWKVSTSNGSFTNLPARPPAWAFSRDWTTVRLAVRGIDERDETVSVWLDADPGMIILR